jgi:type IV secretory pathway TraG/TraD family ATPase VirD4
MNNGENSVNDIESKIELSSARAAAEARALAKHIADPKGRGALDHWKLKASDLLAGLILYVLHKQQLRGADRPSLASIDVELANAELLFHNLWFEMAAMSSICAEVASAGEAMLELPMVERSAVVTVARTLLASFRQLEFDFGGTQ